MPPPRSVQAEEDERQRRKNEKNAAADAVAAAKVIACPTARRGSRRTAARLGGYDLSRSRVVSWRGVTWRGVAWFYPVVVGPSPLVNGAPHFLPSSWPSCPFLRSRQAREAEQLAILEEEKKAASATSAILNKNMGSRKGPDAGTR